jgi:hypothetical protein
MARRPVAAPPTALSTLDYAFLLDELTIGSGVSLAECDFSAAHNLHRLTVIDVTSFAATRRGRRVIAAEQQSRNLSSTEPPQGARAQEEPGDEDAPRGAALRPGELARTYRALRRNREEARDAPGAGDFYYGEMEMRRNDSTRPWGERMVLWLYWAVSDCGLRPLRSLLALMAVFAAATWLTMAVGLSADAEHTGCGMCSRRSRVRRCR